MEAAFAQSKIPSGPFTYTVEQTCGDTVALLVQKPGIGPDRYFVEIFVVSGDKLAVRQRPPPEFLTGSEARTVAAKACGQFSPASPSPINRGGTVPVDPRMTVLLGALMLGIVGAAVGALILHYARPLKPTI